MNRLTTSAQKLNPNLRKIIGNTSWLVADKVLRMGISLFVGVWVARYLGPEQFGLYNYAIAFVSLFSTFSALGLNPIIVRNIVQEPMCKHEALGTAFVLKLLGSLLICPLAVGVIAVLRPGESLPQLMVGVISLGTIFRAFEVVDFWFQSQTQSKYSVLAQNGAFILANLLKILLLQAQAPLIMFAWVFSIEVALSAVGFVIAYQLKGNLIKAWRYSFQYARQLLNDSWTLILSGLVIMIYMRVDQIMLGQMIGDEAVGIYSAAARISEMWYFIPMAIAQSVSPSIIEAKKVSEAVYQARLQKILQLMACLSYVVAIAITLISGHLVNLLYGTNYEEAASILTIHVWAGLFVSQGLVRSIYTTTEGWMQFAFLSTLTGAVINVILNFYLINLYGGIGASVATVISQMVASYLSNLFFPRMRGIFLSQTKALMLLDLVSLGRRG